MMKSRSRKPAVGMDSSRVATYEWSRLNHIRIQKARNESVVHDSWRQALRLSAVL
jgi:hypothetical protein